MKSTRKPAFRSALARLSVTLVVGAALLAANPAYAKNDKNNGNGNSEKHAKSNGNNGHGNDKGNGSSDKKEAVDTARPNELGALNAAHASPNALLHANPNSRVGRIAQFRDAVLETGLIQADRDEAQALLDVLEVPSRGSDAVLADLDLAAISKQELEARIAQLEADKLVEGADLDAIDAEIALAQADLETVSGQIEDLTAELDTANTYEQALSDLTDLDLLLDGRDEIERLLLEAAANKPVTDAVDAEVRSLLGLY